MADDRLLSELELELTSLIVLPGVPIALLDSDERDELEPELDEDEDEDEELELEPELELLELGADELELELTAEVPDRGGVPTALADAARLVGGGGGLSEPLEEPTTAGTGTTPTVG